MILAEVINGNCNLFDYYTRLSELRIMSSSHKHFSGDNMCTLCRLNWKLSNCPGWLLENVARLIN